MSDPIHCDLHDYVEIACLYGYYVRLNLIDGTTCEGKALTTKTQAGNEFLCLEAGKTTIDIPLPTLHRMKVLTAGAQFTDIEFA